MEVGILYDILIILLLSVAVLLICHRVRIPLVAGLILTGILGGPYGLRLIRAVEEVKLMAEIGVALLLFGIGLEFSFRHLREIKKAVCLGGGAQIVFTFSAGFLLSLLFKQPAANAAFVGLLISLSSTAIVLKLLQERAEIDSPHGRTALGILIFQDLAVVPFILVIPLLAGKGSAEASSVFWLIIKVLGVLILAYICAKYIVPRILYLAARTRNREVFLLTVLVVCLGIAQATYHAGLSLALGAFLAGLIISESEYGHHALANIMPFHDVFTSFFFISVGMLLNLGFLFDHFGPIALIALAVLCIKGLLASASVKLLGLPLRSAILTGLALAQVGEFSFVLAGAGEQHGLLNGDSYQVCLAVIVLTMLATPLIIQFSLPLTQGILSMLRTTKGPIETPIGKTFSKSLAGEISDHLVIVGFGVNGRNLARAARWAKIPYLVIESNPVTVKQEKAKNEPIHFGDATHSAMLYRAGVPAARTLVIAINDPPATRRIVALARSLNAGLFIIARPRFLSEMDSLFKSGADEVIPEEFETSVEIFTRILSKYLLGPEEIEKFTHEVRADGYQMFRKLAQPQDVLSRLKLNLPPVEIHSIKIEDNSRLKGKPLSEINPRNKLDITILAIIKDTQIIPNPPLQTQLATGDILVFAGTSEQNKKFLNTL